MDIFKNKIKCGHKFEKNIYTYTNIICLFTVVSKRMTYHIYIVYKYLQFHYLDNCITSNIIKHMYY